MVTLEKHIGILHLAVTDHSHTSLPYLKTPKLINIKHFSSNTSVPARGGNNICEFAPILMLLDAHAPRPWRL